MYTATITHHSIISARTIECAGNLTQAKRKAAAEFGGEFQDYVIIIIDAKHQIVARRKVGAKNWSD